MIIIIITTISRSYCYALHCGAQLLLIVGWALRVGVRG